MKNIPFRYLFFSLFILIGLTDSTYLTIKHLSGEVPTCFLSSSCEKVTTSPYSTIGPVPVAALGTLFYATVGFLFILFVDRKHARVWQLLKGVTASGFLFSLYLVGLQLFVIHALCLYCILSAFSSTMLFLITWLLTEGLGENEIKNPKSQ